MLDGLLLLPGPHALLFVVGDHMLNPLGTFAGSYMIHAWAEALRADPRWRLAAASLRTIKAEFTKSAFLGYPVYSESTVANNTAKVVYIVPMPDGPMTVGTVTFEKTAASDVVIPERVAVEERWVQVASRTEPFVGIPFVFAVPYSFSSYLENLVGYSLDLLKSAKECDRGLLRSEQVPSSEIDRLLGMRRYAGISFKIELFHSFYRLRRQKKVVEIYRKPWPTRFEDERSRQSASVEGTYAFVATGKENQTVAMVTFKVVRVLDREGPFTPINIFGEPKKKG